MAQTKTVIGVFGDEAKAEGAVKELRQKGFSDNEISVVGPDARHHGGGQNQGNAQNQGATTVMGHNVSSGAGWGAGIGGTAGLLATAGALAIPGFGPVLALGPLAATLTAAAGGGLAGALVDFGIPEDQSRQYERDVKEGRFLTVLKTEQDANRAASCLRDQGADNVRVD